MNSFRSFGEWDYVRSLGEGGFGVVNLFKNRITGQEIATKTLKSVLKLRPDEIDILKKRWIQEHNWLQSLNIPFIVNAIPLKDTEFLRYLQNQNQWKLSPVVMEYCNEGDLRSRLELVENVNGLYEREVRDVLHSLRYAVEYLHTKCRIEHRDIKPENIVLHCNDNIKIYKLTDFGYAREIPENTIAQSVVGTRHYVAPEVIHPGSYTNTVDYWSVGVMIFEIICGIRPFIPHRDFRIILTKILEKPKRCIAITETLEKDLFNYEEQIFAENRCTPIFIGKIEKWLGLALDGDYKTRGTDGGILRFYSDLDSILQTRILTVFSLTSYQYFYYDIDLFQDINQFFLKLSDDSKIFRNNMFLILPTSHPKKRIINIQMPQDFYVREWIDSNNAGQPMVMLYVADVNGQCDFNPHKQIFRNHIPETIAKCLLWDNKDYHSVPISLLEHFERIVHFMLSNEARHLDCYIGGLNEYLMLIEHEAINSRDKISRIYDDMMILSGRVKQFECTVHAYAQTLAEQQTISQPWLEKTHKFSNDCQVLKEKVVHTIQKRYESVLKRCKDLTQREIFTSLPKKDIFQVNKFRNHFSEARNRNKSIEKRMSECQDFFDELANTLDKMPTEELKDIHYDISAQVAIYLKIQTNITLTQNAMLEFERRLELETANLLRTHTQSVALCREMNSLCIDGSSDPMSSGGPASSISMNGYSLQNGDISTKEMIEESQNLLQSLNRVWEIDDDINMCNDNYPTTIDEM